MGKPTGFMEYKRMVDKEVAPLERINNWNEFKIHLTKEEQEIQGARCMDCGIPFCHTGMLLSGMASGCPINNLIPEFNDLLYRGMWKEALIRLLKTNNFPEFTGRVCPAPCEGSCTASINDPAISIKSNECAIVDRGFKEGFIKPVIQKTRTGKRVAVVGSGPAGLACAQQLNSAGHWVTVFDRADRAGGLLMYGIPNMKLDKSIVKRRIRIMEDEGIKFILNTEIGKNYSADKLIEEYDSVVLCCGSTKPRDLPIEGRDLHGIHFAMEFLHLNTKSLLDSEHMDKNYIDVEGKDVIVIGGGDTGTDCVATSIRQKCKSINQFEILPGTPLERATNNPWPEWPKIHKLDYGQEEAKAVFGRDPRHYLIMTKKFVGDGKGNLQEVHTVNIEWQKDSNGRYVPIELEGTYKVWPCQKVFISMGFLGPEQSIIDKFGLTTDERTNVKAEYGRFITNVPKVFAAGDMRRGQSLVVWAINEGREAARECDRYLMGYTILP